MDKCTNMLLMWINDSYRNNVDDHVDDDDSYRNNDDDHVDDDDNNKITENTERCTSRFLTIYSPRCKLFPARMLKWK